MFEVLPDVKKVDRFLMLCLRLGKLEQWACMSCNKKMNQTLFEFIFVDTLHMRQSRIQGL